MMQKDEALPPTIAGAIYAHSSTALHTEKNTCKKKARVPLLLRDVLLKIEYCIV